MSLPSRASAVLSHRDGVFGALTLVLFVAISLRLPQFASPGSVADIVDDTAILILLALGQMLVLLTRCVDLSIAANIALSGMCVALLNQSNAEIDVAWIVLIATALGATLGAINGILVWMCRIPSIVVTLGTLAIYRGLVYVVSDGTWVTSNEMSGKFLGFVRSSAVGLSMMSWLALAAIILFGLALKNTAIGRRFFVAGNNPAAAAYVGIDVGRVQFLAFTLSGAIAGLCGYLWVARFAIASADVAQGFELTVIAACVIGGVSIAGGLGTVTGVVLGCAFLGLIRNALPLLGISPFWQMAISGAVIVGAVVINARLHADSRQRILEGAST
jgi:rhamnose transport system permease protein